MSPTDDENVLLISEMTLTVWVSIEMIEHQNHSRHSRLSVYGKHIQHHKEIPSKARVHLLCQNFTIKLMKKDELHVYCLMIWGYGWLILIIVKAYSNSLNTDTYWKHHQKQCSRIENVSEYIVCNAFSSINPINIVLNVTVISIISNIQHSLVSMNIQWKCWMQSYNSTFNSDLGELTSIAVKSLNIMNTSVLNVCLYWSGSFHIPCLYGIVICGHVNILSVFDAFLAAIKLLRSMFLGMIIHPS